MWMKLRKIVNFGPPTLFLWIVPIRVHCFFPASQTFKLHQPSIHQLKFSHSSSESDRQELLQKWAFFYVEGHSCVTKQEKKAKRLSVLLLPIPWVHWRLGDIEVQGHHTKVEIANWIDFLRKYIMSTSVVFHIYGNPMNVSGRNL